MAVAVRLTLNRVETRRTRDGLIVYLGGFPSVGVVALLNSVLSTISDDVPFFQMGRHRFRRLEDLSLPRGNIATQTSSSPHDEGYSRTVR
jgi:hypothetical protein